MKLTLAYLTNRKKPEIQWFFDSLKRQQSDDEFQIIVVDFYSEEPGRKDEFRRLSGRDILHVEPKPNVWSGRFKLPRDDWFSAANSRNTALCLARHEWIGYIDDLSVLMPGWLNCVREAMAGGYVALGSYRKAFGMVVEDGMLLSFERESVDTRVAQVNQDVTPCDGGWLYGCSLAGPVEAFLKVNGWPQVCDGLGSEDCCAGKALRNAGVDLRYDRRMITVESEEGHGQPGNFKKADKGPAGTEADKSHRLLRMAERTTYFCDNPNMRELRASVLAGNPFPIPTEPQYDFYDGTAIKDMV